MIEDFKKLQLLQTQANSLKEEIIKKFGAEIEAKLKRYNYALHLSLNGYGIPDKGDTFYTWEMGNNSIDVEWEKTWNYGGHANGSFTMPLEMLCDESKLVEFEQKCDKCIQDKALAKQKESLDQERKIYEALKAKFG